MSKPQLAAAAPGLPDDTADFHLALGRQIAQIGSAAEQAENDEIAAGRCNPAAAAILGVAGEHLYDREVALITALAASQASTLAGAGVQLAAALRMFSWITSETDPKPEDERALVRLLASAVRVVVDVAQLDPQRDGIAQMAPISRDAWADPRAVIADLFPLASSAAA
jgi:hypothetical protein